MSKSSPSLDTLKSKKLYLIAASGVAAGLALVAAHNYYSSDPQPDYGFGNIYVPDTLAFPLKEGETLLTQFCEKICQKCFAIITDPDVYNGWPRIIAFPR